MDESLVELKAAIEAWRQEAAPAAGGAGGSLGASAGRSAAPRGSGGRSRATKVERARLAPGVKSPGEGEVTAASGPAYWRLEMPPSTTTPRRPFAEVEMPTGVKVRLFTDTGEALGLLAGTCQRGGDARADQFPHRHRRQRGVLDQFDAGGNNEALKALSAN
jgi:hypothetical protein